MTDVDTTQTTTGTEPETITNPPQSPVEQELEREGKRGEGRTEAEKAAFSLKKNADRARELGLDPEEVLGIKKEDKPETTDEVPEWYKREQQKTNSKTALEIAELIEDPNERELVKIKLTTVVTSGDPEERVRVARGFVNAVKNGMIAEELDRKGQPQRFSSGSGAPPKKVESAPELTNAELAFTKQPFNMTPQEIVAKRQA